MPFVNGRFYANPIFGRALERARAANEGRIWSEDYPETELNATQTHTATAPMRHEPSPAGGHGNTGSDHHRKTSPPAHSLPQYENPQNEDEARLANVIHNETSSLRYDPRAPRGRSGSADDLQNARVAIAEVANRVLKSGHLNRVAPSDLTFAAEKALDENPDAIRSHNASLAAAREALAGSNATAGSTQYRLRARHDTKSPINGSPIHVHFGPFRDTLGAPRTVVVAP